MVINLYANNSISFLLICIIKKWFKIFSKIEAPTRAPLKNECVL